MKKLEIEYRKTICLTVTLEVPDDLGEDEIVDKGFEIIDESVPSICASCTGWSDDAWSIDDGDEWQFEDIRKED